METDRRPTREECIAEAAQALVDGIARRNARSPEAAARAALPYGSPAQLAAMTARIAAMRRPPAGDA